jgi:SAM-dependent methyltransferase
MSFETEGSFKRAVRGLCIEASMRTGVFDRSIFSVYNYMFSPSQLIFLTQCLTETRHVAGCCIEIGCAQGRTTAFLRKFMDESGIKKSYYALDTFSGFISEHVDYEVNQRSKNRDINRVFVTNKKKWFDYSLGISGVHSVESIECDATKFEFDRLGPIAFALLDVDLYLPMVDILPKLYRNLSPGGIILVDDCMPHELWDGALAAYEEFVSARGIEHNIVVEKIGIIRKS